MRISSLLLPAALFASLVLASCGKDKTEPAGDSDLRYAALIVGTRSWVHVFESNAAQLPYNRPGYYEDTMANASLTITRVNDSTLSLDSMTFQLAAMLRFHGGLQKEPIDHSRYVYYQAHPTSEHGVFTICLDKQSNSLTYINKNGGVQSYVSNRYYAPL